MATTSPLDWPREKSKYRDTVQSTVQDLLAKGWVRKHVFRGPILLLWVRDFLDRSVEVIPDEVKVIQVNNRWDYTLWAKLLLSTVRVRRNLLRMYPELQHLQLPSDPRQRSAMWKLLGVQS